MPNAEILVRIADYFAVSCDYLCCRTSVRCPMPDAGEHLANASELELALRGEGPPDMPTAYLVAEDIRVVTDDELRLLDLSMRERRRRAKSKKDVP